MTASGPECIKFHRRRACVALGIAVGLLAAWPHSGSADGPRGLLTLKAQQALLAKASARTVTVRRRPPPAPGFVVPGGNWTYARGWLATPGRVITSATTVAGWPLGADDLIEVITPGSAPYTAAVRVLEKGLGLAVLDVPGMKGQAVGPDPALEEGALYGGRAVYAAGENGLLARYAVRGPAAGVYAFYWWIDGYGLPGTPLVDLEGRLVSVIGPRPPNEPRRSLALPTKALRSLFERAPDWRP